MKTDRSAIYVNPARNLPTDMKQGVDGWLAILTSMYMYKSPTICADCCQAMI